MNNNEMQLSLNGNTFEALKEDFDSILASTVGTMEMKCADNATITLKLDIELDKSFGYTKPKFTHNLSSVMQVKQKKSGSLSGEYALVWDEDENRHVLRKVKGDQLNVFEDDIIDVDYQPVEPTMLEAPVEDIVPVLFFDYLKKFVGTQVKVVKNGDGSYAVESIEENENKGAVLISSADEGNENYCSAETLSEHIGHNLYCTGYSEDSDGEIVEICIECEDCEEPIFSVEKKDSAVRSSDEEDGEEDSEYMLKDDEENSDSDDDEEYEYEGPDEI